VLSDDPQLTVRGKIHTRLLLIAICAFRSMHACWRTSANPGSLPPRTF
jgi:hypothetical protein